MRLGKRRAAAAGMATVAVLLAGCTSNAAQPTTSASAGTGGPASSSLPGTVPVSPSEALAANVDGVGSVTGAVGAFASSGTISVSSRPMPTIKVPGVRAAGPGLDVRFDGTHLVAPLTLSFDVGKPPAGQVPVVVHVADDGTTNVLPAALSSNGEIAVATSDFSLNVPAWLDPAAWLHALGDSLASGLGGRTSHLTCPGGPSWFSFDNSTNLVHLCSKPATSAGHPDAELGLS